MLLRCTRKVILMPMYWVHENNKRLINSILTIILAAGNIHFCATFQVSLKVTSESPIWGVLGQLFITYESMLSKWMDPLHDPWTPYWPTGNALFQKNSKLSTTPACRYQRDFASPTPNHLHSSGSKTDLLHSRHDPLKGHMGFFWWFFTHQKSLRNEATDRWNPILETQCHSQESQTSTCKKDTCANQTYLSAGK